MAEKDSDRYRFEQYQTLTGKSCNITTNALKGGEQQMTAAGGTIKTGSISTSNKKIKKSSCSCCCGKSSTTFWFSLLTNLGICTLLFAYTLLGK
jgi:hypothetical protein